MDINEMNQRAKLFNLGAYIQKLHDPVQTHAMYGVPTSQVDSAKDFLKRELSAKKFRTLRAGIPSLSIVCFKIEG